MKYVSILSAVLVLALLTVSTVSVIPMVTATCGESLVVSVPGVGSGYNYIDPSIDRIQPHLTPTTTPQFPVVFTTLDRELSFVDGTTTGYRIPDGSRIRYGYGYTAVYGPTGTQIGNVLDDNAAEWFIPGRSASTPTRCTHSIEVPNNAYIHHSPVADTISMNPDNSDPFATIEYYSSDPTVPTGSTEFRPEKRSPQWVIDYATPIPPTNPRVSATWTVQTRPKWVELEHENWRMEDPHKASGREAKQRVWLFAIFNGIETKNKVTGKWCGILQPVLQWNAIEGSKTIATVDHVSAFTSGGQTTARQGESWGALSNDPTKFGHWSISSHRVGGVVGRDGPNPDIDIHTPFVTLKTATPTITGTVEPGSRQASWDIVTTCPEEGVVAKLGITGLDLSAHQNNLEAVLTFERHNGFDTTYQNDPGRWPGTITFTNVNVKGNEKWTLGLAKRGKQILGVWYDWMSTKNRCELAHTTSTIQLITPAGGGIPSPTNKRDL